MNARSTTALTAMLALLTGAALSTPRNAATAQTFEHVMSSDAFVDTIGYNAHFENPHSAYYLHFPQVEGLLSDAGIRHVRVGMELRVANYPSMMQELARRGIHGDYVTKNIFTQDQIESYPALMGSSVEAYEAPNEPDRAGDPDWAGKLIAFQKNLYTWVKSGPATHALAVIGPSVTGKFEQVGDLSAYMDYANMHNYLDVYNPATKGWGGQTPFGTYGSIRYNMNVVRQVGGQKPIMSTETGYGATPDGSMTASNRPTLDYRAQLRYLPRLFFQQVNEGVVRTYAYEFIDKGDNGTFGHFGIIQSDLTPKPAYYGLKSIIHLLSDPGPPFAASPLGVSFGGDTAHLGHLLLEKRDGTYELALWQEVPSWNPHGGGDIIVPDVRVTLTTDRRFSAATLHAMDESGNFSARNVGSGTSFSVPVSDKISIVSLRP